MKSDTKHRGTQILVSDNPKGPFIYKSSNGELLSIWSTMNSSGYCELISKSDNGKIDGKWNVEQKPVFEGDGGHGMIFKDKENQLLFVMHYPNERNKERPRIMRIKENRGTIVLDGEKL